MSLKKNEIVLFKQSNLKLIAYYLPQFYPIPENDNWWEPGFTEWTNVTKAKPLFEGHNQPRFPLDLGYYDLRVPETREKQAELAKTHGIHGFCYYNYWFGNGRKILDKIAKDVLDSKSPNFPFCFCWANESWRGVWFGVENQNILIEQLYLGEEDYKNYFYYLLDYFKDDRYIKIDGKPFLQIYKVNEIPDLEVFIETFRKLSIKEGFPGIYLVAGIPSNNPDWNPIEFGFDAAIGSEFSQMRYWQRNIVRSKSNLFYQVKDKIKAKYFREEKDFNKRNCPVIIKYEDAIKFLISDKKFNFPYFPVCVHDWDNSPRSTSRSLIFTGSTPELFRNHLTKGLQKVENLKTSEQFVFLKSWNEWGESNALEPDKKWGKEYLRVIKEEMSKYIEW
ncbi:glycosyl transferase family WbsX [Algoriphagus boseongensis]|uniref:Glycosyl transferase family WbsX n=1 Tax=Algoriphagus boseongensis TaxID=1442587 RepID=A0A4R6T8I6_9BACT|nr:glycoside hydrolase family 99-like domain-containing protein [Algoriphagus boseongensis]TDQ19578.1 glycosyl transferase family WbsX [Algoriphagus boseongensis]